MMNKSNKIKENPVLTIRWDGFFVFKAKYEKDTI